jgi:hypothetical protein
MGLGSMVVRIGRPVSLYSFRSNRYSGAFDIVIVTLRRSMSFMSLVWKIAFLNML